MVAKRRLDFSTPSGKRSKPTTMVYRSSKTEMKYTEFDASASGVSSKVTPICRIANGSTRNTRVGHKIKIHRIQAVVAIATGDSTPIKLELILPKVAKAVPITQYLAFPSNDVNTVLYTKYLMAGTDKNPTGYMLNYKLPMGLICQYDGSTSSDIVRGDLNIATSTQGNATYGVIVRVWYTDA